ncbi:MAG: DUF4838 domain-containing protein [Candidatus Hydrogenedentes bacterium]|nr:DUF4838 domain-containing protein [Candidatus Hydrogenedentota bacterium]
MKKSRGLTVLCAAIAVVGCAHFKGGERRGLTLSKEDTALVIIATPPSASPSTLYAGEELRRFLSEITGAQVSVVNNYPNAPANAIVVGEVRGAETLLEGVDIASLGNEGYVLRSDSHRLVIAGGQQRGILYGVYGLLEDHLGCRWFTPEVSRIPNIPNLTIPPLDERVVPRLEYREPFVSDCQDGDWAARNRANSSAARLEEKHGGKVTYFGFVHTFQGLVPPEQYYDQHPEYYSLVDGKRLKDRSQLCCTNPDVVRIVTEEVRKRMAEHPEATVFSVSQNDWYNFCQCEACTALADAEGTQMAPVLSLVNQVAAGIAAEFPDKLIDTLAYQYTRKAPKTMRPEPNVIIRLCSIECCFAHPFVECDSEENRAFVEDVEDWSKVCDRLWVWNYDTSFANYFTPYPNLRVRNDNIRFYADHNVKGIFEQDVYTTLNGELSPLSGYLNAKFLWNPDYDEDTAMDEFLEGVYGKAAKPIRKYIDLLHDRVEKKNIHMNIWIGPDHPVLDDVVLKKADKLWDQAEAAVSGDAAALERVKCARLSVDFAIIERTRAKGVAMYMYDKNTHTSMLRPDFVERINRFLDVATRNGVTNLREQNGSLDLYRQDLEQLLAVTNEQLIPAVEAPQKASGLNFSYYEGAWESLPDFTALSPVRSGIASTIGCDVTEHPELFGLVFTGYLSVPEDGLYAFECTSNDGSKLFIAGRELINHDGLHGSTSKTGALPLAKGLHPIQVRYFNSGGKFSLEIQYEGPGIQRKPIPASVLWHAP